MSRKKLKKSRINLLFSIIFHMLGEMEWIHYMQQYCRQPELFIKNADAFFVNNPGAGIQGEKIR